MFANEKDEFAKGIAPKFCARCAREWRPGEFGCPNCKCCSYMPSARGDVPRLTPDEGLPLFGTLGRIGTLGAGAVLLLTGGRGSGKTSIALQGFDNPTIIPYEMGVSHTRAYCDRLNVKPQRFHPEINWDDVHLGLGEDTIDVVIDSLQEAGARVPEGGAEHAAIRIREWARATRSRVILIGQVNKKGEPAGLESIPHLVDVVGEITVTETGQRRAAFTKSRFGKTKNVMFELGEAKKVPARYYSVEGKPPNYVLAPFPGRSSGAHAGLLKTAAAIARHSDDDDSESKIILPPPPVAVSALDGGFLYAHRWVEPEDAAERRAFALAHGVPYYDYGDEELYENAG